MIPNKVHSNSWFVMGVIIGCVLVLGLLSSSEEDISRLAMVCFMRTDADLGKVLSLGFYQQCGKHLEKSRCFSYTENRKEASGWSSKPSLAFLSASFQAGCRGFEPRLLLHNGKRLPALAGFSKLWGRPQMNNESRFQWSIPARPR